MKKLKIILITILVAFLYYYIVLPPINLHSSSFYFFLAFIALVYSVLDTGFGASVTVISKRVKHIKTPEFKNSLTYTLVGIVGVAIIILVVNFFCSPIFNAKSYQQRITVDETGDFSKDIAEVNFSQLPLLDRASSEVLGESLRVFNFFN